MTINRKAIFAVFNEADNSSASFTERLIALGVADPSTAKPLAMEWAAGKYGARITQGQRGATLPRNSAAERAMYRVLGVCFPSADAPKSPKSPKSPKATANKTDAVAKLFKTWQALSAAEKRRFATLQLRG